MPLSNGHHRLLTSRDRCNPQGSSYLGWRSALSTTSCSSLSGIFYCGCTLRPLTAFRRSMFLLLLRLPCVTVHTAARNTNSTTRGCPAGSSTSSPSTPSPSGHLAPTAEENSESLEDFNMQKEREREREREPTLGITTLMEVSRPHPAPRFAFHRARRQLLTGEGCEGKVGPSLAISNWRGYLRQISIDYVRAQGPVISAQTTLPNSSSFLCSPL